MKLRALEGAVYLAAIAVLAALLWVEGSRTARLQGKVPLPPKDLYRTLTRTQARVQVLDVREDLSDGYEDTHVPGALPFPGCDPEKTPPAARERIVPYLPTVIVSEEGDRSVFERCAGRFAQARNLEGGIAAWVELGLPEDTGEYVPPKAGAGGGCL